MSDTTTTNPWDKLPDESVVWFARFKDWLKQDKPRSYLEIYNQDRERRGQKRSDCPAQNWRIAFERWDWKARAEAWDKAEDERLDREKAQEREEQRQREMEDAAKVRAKAAEMLELPLTEEARQFPL